MENNVRIFIIICCVLGAGNFLILNSKKSAEFKKKYFFSAMIIASLITILFLAFFTEASKIIVLALIPVAGLGSYVAVKTQKFCLSCGKMILQQMGGPMLTSCPSCESKLR